MPGGRPGATPRDEAVRKRLELFHTRYWARESELIILRTFVFASNLFSRGIYISTDATKFVQFASILLLVILT